MDNDNVIPFTKIAPERQNREEIRKKRNQTIADKVTPKVDELKTRTRGISEKDRLRFALNLGDMIIEIAREKFEGNRNKALKAVWAKKQGSDLGFEKRLRYIRFYDEEKDKPRTEVIAGSGIEFINLAKAIATLQERPNVDLATIEIESLRRLMVGTEFDVDPEQNAKIDFDAIRELGEILADMEEVIKDRVPQLENYFKRCVSYGVQYFGEENTLGNLATNNFNKYSDEHFVSDNYYKSRIEVDAKKSDRPCDHNFIPYVSSSQGMIEGRLDPEMIYDGKTFDEIDYLSDLHFPKILLGNIRLVQCFPMHCYNSDYFAHNDKVMYSSMLLEPGKYNNLELLIDTNLNIDIIAKDANEKLNFLENTKPNHNSVKTENVFFGDLEFDLFLSLTWGGLGEKSGLRWSFIIWPTQNPRYYNNIGKILGELNSQIEQKTWEFDLVHLPFLSSLVRRDAIAGFLEKYYSSGLWGDIKECPNILWQLNSDAAQKLLGTEILGYDLNITDIEDWYSQFAYFDSEITIPPKFAPHSSRSIAGIIVRNILYAEGKDNILEKLIEDAQLRVDWLDKHYQEWMAEYSDAKANFKNKFSKKSPSEGDKA